MASFNDLVQQYTDMRQGLKQLDLELGTQWQPEDVELEEGDEFANVMTQFRDQASNKFELLETLYVNMDAKWKDVMMYYGENPQVMRPDDFFKEFARFVSSWKDAAIAEEKHAQKQEREEQRKREEEQRKERKRQKQLEKEKETAQSVENVDLSEEATTGTDDDRRMMDNLLEKLRSGEAETTVRARRRRHQRQEQVPPSPSEVEADMLAQDLLKNLQSEQ